MSGPAFVQLLQAVRFPTAVTAFTITIPSAGVTAGDSIILVISTYSSGQTGASSVSDSAGNTYTQDLSTSGGALEVWRCAPARALGSGQTISVTLLSSSSGGVIAIETTSTKLDKTATNSGSFSTPSTGTTAATSVADEFVLACCDTYDGPTTETGISTSGYTFLSDSGGPPGPAAGYLLTTVAGAQSATFNTFDSSSWTACILTYEAGVHAWTGAGSALGQAKASASAVVDYAGLAEGGAEVNGKLAGALLAGAVALAGVTGSGSAAAVSAYGGEGQGNVKATTSLAPMASYAAAGQATVTALVRDQGIPLSGVAPRNSSGSLLPAGTLLEFVQNLGSGVSGFNGLATEYVLTLAQPVRSGDTIVVTVGDIGAAPDPEGNTDTTPNYFLSDEVGNTYVSVGDSGGPPASGQPRVRVYVAIGAKALSAGNRIVISGQSEWPAFGVVVDDLRGVLAITQVVQQQIADGPIPLAEVVPSASISPPYQLLYGATAYNLTTVDTTPPIVQFNRGSDNVNLFATQTNQSDDGSGDGTVVAGALVVDQSDTYQLFGQMPPANPDGVGVLLAFSANPSIVTATGHAAIRTRGSAAAVANFAGAGSTTVRATASGQAAASFAAVARATVTAAAALVPHKLISGITTGITATVARFRGVTQTAARYTATSGTSSTLSGNTATVTTRPVYSGTPTTSAAYTATTSTHPGQEAPLP